jgi:cobalt/nickel transport system permease protein
MKHHFLDEESTIESPIRDLNPKTKFITVISVVILVVSTPATAYGAFLSYAVLLSLLILVSRIPIIVFLRRALVVVPFILVAAVSIPFMNDGPGTSYSLGIGALAVSRSGLLIVFNVAAKSILSVVFLTLLISTTPFSDLLLGLRELSVPGFIADTLSFMYHYVFILVDEAERVSWARDARLFGNRWIWQAPTIGYMVGSIFVRSFERGERIFLAMKARGYDSGLTRGDTGRPGGRDLVFFTVVVGLASVTRIIGGMS